MSGLKVPTTVPDLGTRWLDRSHDPDCATNIAQETGHYEGKFGTTRHWVYDDTVKCNCPAGKVLAVVVAAREVDIDNGPLPTDEECPDLGIDPIDLIPARNLREAIAALSSEQPPLEPSAPSK